MVAAQKKKPVSKAQEKRKRAADDSSVDGSSSEDLDNTKSEDEMEEDDDLDDSEWLEDDAENEQQLDQHEFHKLLHAMFPSKHMERRVKKEEEFKARFDKDRKEKADAAAAKPAKKTAAKKKCVAAESPKKEKKPAATATKAKKSKVDAPEVSVAESPTKKRKAKTAPAPPPPSPSEKSEETAETVPEDSSASSESSDPPPKVAKKKSKQPNVMSLIFSLDGDGGDYDEDDDDANWSDYDSEYEEYDLTENEDDEVSTDEDSSNEEEEEEGDGAPSNAEGTDPPTKEQEEAENVELMRFIKDPAKAAALQQLLDLAKQNPEDSNLRKCIDMYKQEFKKEKKRAGKKLQKTKDRNGRIFRRILRDKNANNDNDYFEKLDVEQQKKIIKELREINKITRIEKPYRISLLESTNIPIPFKAAAMKKINTLRSMDHAGDEYYKIKSWVDAFMRIPFTSFRELPVTLADGVEKCHDFMANAQRTLDEAVYGLDDAKMQIMQMLGQLITNPQSIGTSIAIHGPPGTGKTSLVKEGISKILNRPFAFIALGGATDSGFLEGHGSVYVGSGWGKIVQIIMDSGCMNPVIYFDELDKISETPRGEEIANILTHLTDTSQNMQFSDKYFPEINFDLSKCLFIFSYNDESKVNPILRDRMYRIRTNGYSPKEKTIIANQYLLPRVRNEVKFAAEDVVINDGVIGHIIETYCGNESGVRNLKRCMEIIHSKLNLYRLMRPGSNLFAGEMSLKVEFPLTVTRDMVDKLIKKDRENISALHSMYV